MNFNDLAVWAAGIATLISLATTIWNLLASGSRANARKIEDQDQRLNRHETRLTSVEQSVRGMPSTGDLHKIELALSRMEGELGIMGQRLQPVAAIAERMQELLIQQSRK